MKTLLLALSCFAVSMTALAQETRLFEMRTYHASSGRIEALQARFQGDTSRLFDKHGVTVIGYWLPVNAQGQTDNRLICLLAYPDRPTREAVWKALVADPDWRSVHHSTEPAGRLVDRIENVFLKATDYSPPIQASSGETLRFFQLRTYKAAPGKLAALQGRFRNHTVELFTRHGMTHIGYWTPVEKDKGADDTLIYILAHDSQPAADASFQAFRSDPDWLAARKASEADGSLTTRVETINMKPTKFSPIR